MIFVALVWRATFFLGELFATLSLFRNPVLGLAAFSIGRFHAAFLWQHAALSRIIVLRSLLLGSTPSVKLLLTEVFSLTFLWLLEL